MSDEENLNHRQFEFSDSNEKVAKQPMKQINQRMYDNQKYNPYEFHVKMGISFF